MRTTCLPRSLFGSGKAVGSSPIIGAHTTCGGHAQRSTPWLIMRTMWVHVYGPTIRPWESNKGVCACMIKARPTPSWNKSGESMDFCTLVFNSRNTTCVKYSINHPITIPSTHLSICYGIISKSGDIRTSHPVPNLDMANGNAHHWTWPCLEPLLELRENDQWRYKWPSVKAIQITHEITWSMLTSSS